MPTNCNPAHRSRGERLPVHSSSLIVLRTLPLAPATPTFSINLAQNPPKSRSKSLSGRGLSVFILVAIGALRAGSGWHADSICSYQPLRTKEPHENVHEQLQSKRPAAIQQHIPWRGSSIRKEGLVILVSGRNQRRSQYSENRIL